MKNMALEQYRKGETPLCKAIIVLLIASAMLFPLASIPEVTRAYTPTLEDIEYMEWQKATGTKLLDDSNLIVAELEKGIFGCDWEYLRTLSKLTYNHAETALNEIDQFEVSPEYEPIKKEYKLSLIDTKWKAYYMKEAAEDYLSGDFEGAADNLEKSDEYTKSSLAHLEKVLALMEALPTPSPTPTPRLPTPSPTPTPRSPSYEAIFAIVGLLAVVHLVRRKK